MPKALKGARNIQTTKSIKKENETMNYMNLLKLNLQFFSQDDTGGSNDNDQDQGDNTNDDNQDDQQDDKKDDNKDEKTITLTQKQLDKMMSDREKRALKDKDEAIEEAKKLAKMNADQKKEYEHEKTAKENEKLKAELNRYELGKEASKILSDSDIVASEEILNVVVRDNAEETSASVQAFVELVNKASNEKVKKALRQETPPAGGSQKATSIGSKFAKTANEQAKPVENTIWD